MTKLMRAQIGRNVIGIDTTVKSAQGIWRAFAPRWEMVLGYKNGTVSEAEYTVQYEQILTRVPDTVCCYCRSRSFCHTHLIIDFAVRHWPDQFQDGRDPAQIPPGLHSASGSDHTL